MYTVKEAANKIKSNSKLIKRFAIGSILVASIILTPNLKCNTQSQHQRFIAQQENVTTIELCDFISYLLSKRQ